MRTGKGSGVSVPLWFAPVVFTFWAVWVMCKALVLATVLIVKYSVPALVFLGRTLAEGVALVRGYLSRRSADQHEPPVLVQDE